MFIVTRRRQPGCRRTALSHDHNRPRRPIGTRDIHFNLLGLPRLAGVKANRTGIFPWKDGTLPAPPLNGDGHTWHHGDGLLYRIVREGGKMQEDPVLLPNFKSAMPAFGAQLSHEEIVAVLTYIKGWWGDKTSRGLSIVEAQANKSNR